VTVSLRWVPEEADAVASGCRIQARRLDLTNITGDAETTIVAIGLQQTYEVADFKLMLTHHGGGCSRGVKDGGRSGDDDGRPTQRRPRCLVDVRCSVHVDRSSLRAPQSHQLDLALPPRPSAGFHVYPYMALGFRVSATDLKVMTEFPERRHDRPDRSHA